MLTYPITATDHCRSSWSYLRNLLPRAPLSYLSKLFTSSHLTVNGTPASPETVLAVGDSVCLKESGRTRSLLVSDPPLLDILFEDDTLLIINKPAGLPMHRTAEAGDDNLVAVAERVMANRDTPVKLRPVNRLDRGTSGAALLAKSATSAGMFGRFVKEVGLGKLYLAIVAGTPPAEGTVTEPLDGKDAETRFRTILQWPQKSLLAVAPITGRMHQIRRHLRLIGHPVLGDRRYGGAMLPGTTGHLLHAFRVSLEHPVSGREITVHAPLPVSFIMQLRALTDEEAAATLVSLRQLSI